MCIKKTVLAILLSGSITSSLYAQVRHHPNSTTHDINAANTAQQQSVPLLKPRSTNTMSSKRYLSADEVNAIQFDLPIVSLHYPKALLARDSQGKPAISYSKNNKAFIFLLETTHRKSAQFLVSLQNGQLLSLHFPIKHLPGSIIYIPQSVKASPHKAQPPKNLMLEDSIEHKPTRRSSRAPTRLDVDAKRLGSTKEAEILSLMKKILAHDHGKHTIQNLLGKAWQPIQTTKITKYLTLASAPNTKLILKRQTAWAHQTQYLECWTACSNSYTTLYLDLVSPENNPHFNPQKAPLLKKSYPTTQALLLENNIIPPSECTYIWILKHAH